MSGQNQTGKPVKTPLAVGNAPTEAQLACAQPAGLGDSGPAWFAVSGRDASSSRGETEAQAAHSTGSRRKRQGSRWCISRAHWPAGLSAEQSCGSSCKKSRARGRRCPPPVCAGIRARGESAHSRVHVLTTQVRGNHVRPTFGTSPKDQ